jgi:hypothetical protein
VVLGVAATWLGITFAYDSFYWFPSRRGLPVSFFVVMVVVVEFTIVTIAQGLRTRRAAPSSATRPMAIGV